MRLRIRLKGAASAALVAAMTVTLGVTLAPPASAVPSTATCASTVVISARGSLEKTGSGSAWPVAERIRDTFTKSVRTDHLSSMEYPATIINYPFSVAAGETALRGKLNRLVAKCKTTTRIVLVGYSQGAHVIGNVIDTRGTQLSTSVRNQIRAVVLLGDPTFRPNQNYSAGNYDKLRGGMFGRPAGAFGAYATRIRSYCNKGDKFCQDLPLGGKAADLAHADYKKHTGAAYTFVRSRF